MSDLLDTHYFAYGTLLGLTAIREFCPSAELVAQGQVAHRTLVFRKYAGGEGEGGCSTVEAPHEVLQGAIYRLPIAEFTEMDHRARRHWNWFDRIPVEVRTVDGSLLSVSTYHIPEPLGAFAPPESYTKDIFDGAAELGLPAWYVQRLHDIVDEACRAGEP